MNEPKPLSYKEQAELFKARGMLVEDIAYATRMLRQLGYYRIKDVARPLVKDLNQNLIYQGISFDQVITRYYQDKNLRVYLMHCIEEIEVSIKTNVAYILGKNGPFNYLEFSYWCNRKEYCKHYLLDRQKDFLKKLRSKVYNSTNPEITRDVNLNNKKYPSIWLAVDVLTFGDIVHLIDLMSKKNLKNLADCYQCTPNELVSWIKCLKFVRNVCAHNSNIIDINLTTTPVILEEWKTLLYKFEVSNQNYIYTNKIAVVICILKRIMASVNPDYNYNKIYSPISTIASTDSLAQQLGFSCLNSIDLLFPKKKNKKRKKNRPKKCKKKKATSHV